MNRFNSNPKFQIPTTTSNPQPSIAKPLTPTPAPPTLSTPFSLQRLRRRREKGERGKGEKGWFGGGAAERESPSH